MKQRYQHALVLGLGESGEAAARLLRGEGAAVTAIDRDPGVGAQPRARGLVDMGVRVMASDQALPTEDFDVCVTSPGVPQDSPWIREARARRLPLLAELELGWSRFAGRVVAVSGTNGKSTAVKWMAESLVAEGLRAEPAGNYGPAVCRVVREHPALDWLVLEVSSFQLETTRDFRAEVGLLLNIMPNHIDRHGDPAAYERLKARLFERSRPGDVCLVHEECLDRVRQLAGGQGSWHSFGTSSVAEYAYRNGAVYRGAEQLADLSGTYFANDVLGSNAAGVIGSLHAAGRSLGAAVEAARAFRPLPHRMEEVAVKRGVRFVNDSKATTLSALAAAVRMCGRGTRLIAGGLLKEKDLEGVKEMLAEQGAGLYLIGRASEQMASAWSSVAPCKQCGTLDAAVAAAWRDARSGDTVLLSPGCASFDQFRSYEERGERFRQIVGHLTGE